MIVGIAIDLIVSNNDSELDTLEVSIAIVVTLFNAATDLTTIFPKLCIKVA